MMHIGRTSDLVIALCWVPEMMSFLCAMALERGIEVDYVKKLIRKRGLIAPGADVAGWPRPLKIFTLGRFEILRDDVPIEFSRKAPRKLVSLLKFIIAHGSRGVTVQQVTDSLWTDLEADAAHEALSTNLHRLRKLLGRSEAIRLIEGRISIDSSLCWVDALAFEHLSDSCISAWQKSDGMNATEYAERAATVYRGSFLPHDSEETWSVPIRERLRARFVRLVLETSVHWERAGDLERAMIWFRRGIETDNLAEEFYQGLMRCYASQGRLAEGATVYRQLKQILSVVLGVAPSPVTQALGRQVMGGA